MANSTYYKNLVADQLFGRDSAAAIPTTLYVAVSTTSASPDGTGFTEPTDAAYARVAVPNNKSSFTAAENGVVKNKIDIEFPESTADWGVIVQTGVFDAATGGNLLMYDTLNKSKTIESETVFYIKANSMTLTVCDCTETA